MDKGLKWLEVHKEMLEHRISYGKEHLEHLENELSAVKEIINKMEQPYELPQETNAD